MRTETRLENILNFVDGHYGHRVYRHVIPGEIVGYYDVTDGEVGHLMCTEMTASAYVSILEEYSGDAEVLFKAFAEDAVNQGLPRELRFNVIEVWPNNKSGREFPEGTFDRIRDFDEDMCWDDCDEGFVVALDTSTGDMAVYERYGSVCCLIDRWEVFVNVRIDVKDEFQDGNEMIRGVLEDEATNAGFNMMCQI